jgi:glucose/arabinose dehydrogenase
VLRSPLVNVLFSVCLLSVGGVVLSSGVQAQEKPFYLTVETPPAPELSVQQALESFHIAPGFSVELVAAEPLVEDPVAITWDESGRMYVVEMRGFMPDSYGNNDEAPVGMVVRLTDKDGDGRIDSREVLLDNLVLPRAIAIVNEGLLIAEPPRLWLCPNNGACIPSSYLCDNWNDCGDDSDETVDVRDRCELGDVRS